MITSMEATSTVSPVVEIRLLSEEELGSVEGGAVPALGCLLLMAGGALCVGVVVGVAVYYVVNH